MKDIIKPVERAVIAKELNEDVFVRKTNFGDNEIFIINAFNAPETLAEIGRLREYTFRKAGGGTGKEIDIDEFDTCENGYEQLIVWNPIDKEIVGGYRFIKCDNISFNEHGLPNIATTELFSFSEKFRKQYLPVTIELGRSFVQPQYQPSINSRKGFFSLDNLWDGLGALVIDNPYIRYFFGKVTMYPHVEVVVRDLILYFLEVYFPDKDDLVTPLYPLEITTSRDELKQVITGNNYQNDLKQLSRTLRNRFNENIPPLVNAYMNLSSTMKNFGTAVNPGFGNVHETGILVCIDDIYETKKKRHLSTYTSKH